MSVFWLLCVGECGKIEVGDSWDSTSEAIQPLSSFCHSYNFLNIYCVLTHLLLTTTMYDVIPMWQIRKPRNGDAKEFAYVGIGIPTQLILTPQCTLLTTMLHCFPLESEEASFRNAPEKGFPIGRLGSRRKACLAFAW